MLNTEAPLYIRKMTCCLICQICLVPGIAILFWLSRHFPGNFRQFQNDLFSHCIVLQGYRWSYVNQWIYLWSQSCHIVVALHGVVTLSSMGGCCAPCCRLWGIIVIHSGVLLLSVGACHLWVRHRRPWVLIIHGWGLLLSMCSHSHWWRVIVVDGVVVVLWPWWWALVAHCCQGW